MSISHCDLLLRADIIVTQDAQRRIVEGGAVAIDGGTIREVGPQAELDARWQAEHNLDLGRKLVMPGLVNAHTHASMTVFRGVADDLPLMTWLTENIWPVEKALSKEIIHFGALLACAEMIRTGTTCFCDMYLMEAETARAVDEAGIRAVLGEGIFAFPSPAYAKTEDAWPIIEDLHARYKGHERIRTAIMPHAVYTTTPEILKQSWELAQAHDCIWKTHLSESETETRTSLEQFGRRPLDYLESLGISGSKCVFAHCVDLTPEEMARMAETGAHVVHCPQSNMKLTSGMARIEDLRRAGVNVCLGTDGAASNNDLNMFLEMNSAALLQKVRTMDPTALNAQAALDMATVNGAKALGWEVLGCLEAGKAADLIALDLNQPNMLPLYNPVSHLAYASSGMEICLTMVNGKVLYEHGRYATMDMDGLAREAVEVARWVKARAHKAN
ncbi:cytosine deaminase-like metal-dependent hydrolase [Desulfocurvibacter africanus PCS]|uniref:5-methylthioadenosine/S-adenosylhomocysteine deaminase n=1 Tax=Desulfocurvibacter africanus PCS TaxID=1262666 RepID=M5PWE3_DESAF|nr:amidohydrolase [Desulfocurvibacter africanus]EMG38627.1 cytosine deaminase-like metal-dependent hydrolase [Desulfocurvibacter africanus PCS]